MKDNPIDSHPIFIVVSQHVANSTPLGQYGLPHLIIKVVECTFGEFTEVFQREVTPLQNQMWGIDSRIYSRTPDDPFAEWKRPKPIEPEEPGWLPGDKE